jgi:hypothetical protein
MKLIVLSELLDDVNLFREIKLEYLFVSCRAVGIGFENGGMV